VRRRAIWCLHTPADAAAGRRPSASAPSAAAGTAAASPVGAGSLAAAQPSFVDVTVAAMRVQVLNSAIRVDDKGKAYTTYTFAILGDYDIERWRIEKRFSDFLALDERVRRGVGGGGGERAALPRRDLTGATPRPRHRGRLGGPAAQGVPGLC